MRRMRYQSPNFDVMREPWRVPFAQRAPVALADLSALAVKHHVSATLALQALPLNPQHSPHPVSGVSVSFGV